MDDSRGPGRPRAEVEQLLTALTADEVTGARVPDDGLRVEKLERLEAELAYVDRALGDRGGTGAHRRVVDDADEALRRLFSEGADAALLTHHVAATRAVILSDGTRPVGFVVDGFVDLAEPALSGWRPALEGNEETIRAVAASTGRLELGPPTGPAYAGTAWMVADDLVVTNAHVLRTIGRGERVGTAWVGTLAADVAVSFGREAGAEQPGLRVGVRRVRSVGPAGLEEHAYPGIPSLNFDGLDAAVLELEQGSTPNPPPLRRHGVGGALEPGLDVFLIGYPGDPFSTTPQAYASVFDRVAGVKRIALGTLTTPPGEVAHDPRAWMFEHDVSTIGGNSGSPVAALSADRGVVGLHVGGQHERTNWAHAVHRVPWDALLPS